MKRIFHRGLPVVLLGTTLLFAGGCAKGSSEKDMAKIPDGFPETEQVPETEQFPETEPDQTAEQISETVPLTDLEQLSVFAKNYDAWCNYPESWYAVYDLDGDGRLELIANFIQGSGHFSSNYFYRVEGNEVVELEQPMQMGENQFDLQDYEPTAYLDEDTGIIYYAVCDWQRGGFGDYGYMDGFFWMEDGRIYQEIVRSSHDWYREEEEVHTYYDGAGFGDNIILQEEWEQLYADFIEGMKKEEVQFAWFDLSLQEAAQETVILDKLTASYEEGAD